MNKQRIAIIIPSFIGIIATFMPFVRIWSNSISLIETGDGTGYIIIIAFAISLIVALLGNPQNAIRKGHLAGIIIPGVIPGVLLLLFVLSRMGDDFFGLFTSFGIGFYLVITASLSILIFGLALIDNDPSDISENVEEDIYCSECGKKYSSEFAGKFCEECGNEL